MDLLRRMDELSRRPWFGDAVLLLICGAVIGLAAVMTATDDVVSLFGWDVPVVCGFRRLTGVSCPGCGLTRSFVYAAHGHPLDAFRMNPFGPIGFLFVAAQVPIRAFRLWRPRVRRPAGPERRPAR